VCISKGLSSGYSPLGATLVSDAIFRTIKNSPTGRFLHGHTFGGNPLSAAVGLAVIDLIAEQNLLAQVQARGDYLLKALAVALKRHPCVGDIRGRGLLAGVEFVADKRSKRPFPPDLRFARKLARRALDAGLYVYPGGGSANGQAGDHVLIAPPYTITEAALDDLVRMLKASVEETFTEVGRTVRETPQGAQ